MSVALRLDHVSILVRDLAVSAAFYQEILGLPEIECKIGVPHIRWFGIGPNQSVHLIEGDFGNTCVKHSTHFCLTVPHYDRMKRHFQDKGITYYDAREREGQENLRPLDGIRQIYIQDPDKYWVEINDDCEQTD